jgi:uncharacterized membrane protein YqiK
MLACGGFVLDVTPDYATPAFFVPIALGTLLLVALPGFFLLRKAIVHLPASEALIVYGGREPRVYLHRAVVIPTFQKPERVDLSTKTLRLVRRGMEALLTRDDRVEIDFVVQIRVDATSDAILRVGKRFGGPMTFETAPIQEVFGPRILSRAASVVARSTYAEITRDRRRVEQDILAGLNDLDGFVIDALSIERVELPSPEHRGPFR